MGVVLAHLALFLYVSTTTVAQPSNSKDFQSGSWGGLAEVVHPCTKSVQELSDLMNAGQCDEPGNNSSTSWSFAKVCLKQNGTTHGTYRTQLGPAHACHRHTQGILACSATELVAAFENSGDRKNLLNFWGKTGLKSATEIIPLIDHVKASCNRSAPCDFRSLMADISEHGHGTQPSPACLQFAAQNKKGGAVVRSTCSGNLKCDIVSLIEHAVKQKGEEWLLVYHQCKRVSSEMLACPAESPTADSGDSKSGSGSGSGPDDCLDDPAFLDAKGFACTGWTGYDCSLAALDWGYTAEEEAHRRSDLHGTKIHAAMQMMFHLIFLTFY